MLLDGDGLMCDYALATRGLVAAGLAPREARVEGMLRARFGARGVARLARVELCFDVAGFAEQLARAGVIEGGETDEKRAPATERGVTDETRAPV